MPRRIVTFSSGHQQWKGRHCRKEARVSINRELRPIVWLHEAAALDAGLTGAKAANLARAASAGLPVLPGFVVTTAATAAGLLPEGLGPALRDALDRLPKDGPGQCVVRSSSTVEDSSTSSMA